MEKEGDIFTVHSVESAVKYIMETLKSSYFREAVGIQEKLSDSIKRV